MEKEVRIYPPESSWNDPPTVAQIASMNKALRRLKRPEVTEMNRPDTRWQARDAGKELWDEVKDGPRVKAAAIKNNLENEKMGNRGKAESSLRELQELLPVDIRQGYTNTFEEELTLISRNVKDCDFEEITSSLMNVGWWSQEISGRLNDLVEKKEMNPQERQRIGEVIVKLEHTLINELKKELAKNCECKLKEE